MKSFILGGGCFWCLDSAYMQFKGVIDVEVGYMGGDAPEPTYEAVCSGTTGHAEVARVIFDETQIPEDVILDIFFTIHDPTQVNRQGNDIGTQYRTSMFYTDDLQRSSFVAALERAKKIWGENTATEITPASDFWMGEEYHQDFFAKNPNQGYCVAVVAPKVGKARKAFEGFLR